MVHFEDEVSIHDAMPSIPSIEEDTYRFMELAEQLPAFDQGEFNDPKVRSKRMKMLLSEFNEYLLAEQQDDPVEVADGLVDICWVAIGSMFKLFGVQATISIIETINASNLSKVDGSIGPMKKNEFDKVIKPFGWIDPKSEIYQILEAEGVFNDAKKA